MKEPDPPSNPENALQEKLQQSVFDSPTPHKTSRKKVHAERKSSNRGMWIFMVFVLMLAITAPLVLLKPKSQVYLLKNWTSATIAQGTMTQSNSVYGSLVPAGLARVPLRDATPVQLSVQAGQQVKKGQVVGKYQDPNSKLIQLDLQNNLLKLEEELQNARLLHQLTLQNLRIDLENQQLHLDLKRREVQAIARTAGKSAVEPTEHLEISRLEGQVQKTQNTLHVEQQQWQTSQRQLQQQRKLLNQKLQLQKQQDLILAPISGKIVELSSVDPDGKRTLLVIEDHSRWFVQVNLPETDVNMLALQQEVQVTYASQTLKGTIEQFSNEVSKTDSEDRAANTILTRVRLHQPGPMRRGSRALVEYTTRELQNVLYLPQGPYLTSNNRNLFVIGPEGSATKRQVVFGISNQNSIQVLEGVEKGEKVITSSYDAFLDQHQIQLVPAGENP